MELDSVDEEEHFVGGGAGKSVAELEANLHKVGTEGGGGLGSTG